MDVGMQRGSGGDWKKMNEGNLWSGYNNITKREIF